MLNDDQLKMWLNECKIGMDIPEESDDFDKLLAQKIRVVRASMVKAGVKDDRLSSDLALGVMVMGVQDIWDSSSGKMKFSNAYYSLLGQLAMG